MPQDNRVFPAGTGGNPAAPQIGSASNLNTTAQPPIRPPPDPFVQKSVEPFVDDDNIPGFVDGAGNRIWHVDTSASAKAITFVSAGESVDFDFVVKWTKGANGLKIMAASGKVGGTTTYAGVVAGDAYSFRSDGTDYQLVAQATDQSFVTSNSLSIALAAINFSGSQSFTNLTVGGSATFSQTVAFLTSINVSGTASIGTLVVSGTASFSATVVFTGVTNLNGVTNHNAQANFGATASFSLLPTFNGGAIGWVKIGSVALSDVLTGNISGSWSAYTALRIDAFYKVSTTGIDPALQISSDNGTSYFLQGGAMTPPSGNMLTHNGGNISTSYSGVSVMRVCMVVANITGTTKYISGEQVATNGLIRNAGSFTILSAAVMSGAMIHDHMEVTATANSAIVNQISFAHRNVAGTTLTMSSGILYLYGLA